MQARSAARHRASRPILEVYGAVAYGNAWEEPLARAQFIERQYAEDVREIEKQRNKVHDAHAEGGQHADGVHAG